MSALKSIQHCHVAWSKNHKDKFVAISSDVKLFEFTNQNQLHSASDSPKQVNKYCEVDGNAVQTSTIINRQSRTDQHSIDHFMNSRLVATGPEISSFKAAACYPGSIADDDTLVAISCGGAQNTGKIVLVCLRPAGNYSIDNYVHVDLVAKRAMCNDVDWSYVNNSLLATAWDRHKVDNSLQIYDINRIIETSKYSFNFSTTPNNRPVFDGCSSDSINSLEWFRKEQSLVCGVNGKQVRVFDIRDLTKPKLTTPPTRAVYGLTVDPYSDRRFASYVDNTLSIWDIRIIDKPLVTIVESKPITHISWCPTRNHTFSALMSGDDFVKIYDIQQASLFSEDFEAKIVERLIHPFAQASRNSSSSSPTTNQTNSFDQATLPGSFMGVQNIPKQITSYDWHPTSEFRLIAISNTRDVIALNICDRITLNWSPICEIVWTKGKKILQCLDPRDEKYKTLDDISVNMRHRAITNYGMIVEEGPHHQRGDDSDLIGLLRWVKLAKALDITSKKTMQQQHNNQIGTTATTDNSNHCTEILGVGSLLRDSQHQAPSRAEVKAINWKGTAATSCVMSPIRFQVYHSEIRSRALLLCDWIPDIDNISQTIPIIDYLEKEGNYMRAAAIAVFNMRLQRAIDSLTMGATKSDPNLSSVAMALSGYTGERTSMWREMCQSLKNRLTNPYMKAMFAFLTSDSDTSFHEIIYDKELILADRVAFSLLYLPDDKLNDYLTETMSFLVDNGDLNGILLTGITNDGLSLLQRYIEISSDIQSVSLIVLHSLPSAICNDQRAQLWVECYRGLLDCWRLWHQRAQFDNLWYGNSHSSVKPPAHILISCNYCGNAINSQKSQQPPPPPPPLPPPITSNTAQSSSNNNGLASQQQTQQQQTTSQLGAIITTDYYQSQQVASSVPVTISGLSINSVTSNSSTTTSTTQSSTALTTNIPAGNATLSGGSSTTNTALTPTLLNSMGSLKVQDSSTTTTSSGVGASSSAVSPTSMSGGAIKPISGHRPMTASSGSAPISAAGGRGKSCSNCKKCSYAKCCLCLTQLGSNQILFDHKNWIQQQSNRNNRRQQQALNSQQHPVKGKQSGIRANPFTNWFSWCQTCRHGAHSAHLLSWFSENSECPVSGCDCRCMNLDSRIGRDDLQRS